MKKDKNTINNYENENLFLMDSHGINQKKEEPDLIESFGIYYFKEPVIKKSIYELIKNIVISIFELIKRIFEYIVFFFKNCDPILIFKILIILPFILYMFFVNPKFCSKMLQKFIFF